MKLTRILLSIALLWIASHAQLCGQDVKPTFISRPPDYVTVSEAIAIGAEARVKSARKKNKSAKTIKLGVLEWSVIQQLMGRFGPKMDRSVQGNSGIKDMVAVTLDRQEWDKVEDALGTVRKNGRRRFEK